MRETVVDGITGRLVDRDPDSIAKALDDLLLHPDRAAGMGRRGRAWVQERWTWDRSVARIGRELEVAAGR